MMGWAHALVGAAIGSLFGSNKAGAFTAGFVSHAAGDMIPHKESTVVAELACLGAALGAVAARYGLDSSEFAGAIGAVSPDFEHVPIELGLIKPGHELYPTHNGTLPHNTSKSYLTQIVTASAAVIAAKGLSTLIKRLRQPSSDDPLIEVLETFVEPLEFFEKVAVG